MFEQANIIRKRCDRGALLPIGQKCPAIEIFDMTGAIDKFPFYSRVAGFHVIMTTKSFLLKNDQFAHNNRFCSIPLTVLSIDATGHELLRTCHRYVW